MSRQQIVAATLVFAAATMIGALTLTPGPPGSGGPGFFCMLCDERWLADSLLNVLLFVPLGVGFEALGISPKRALFISLGCSALIEFLQATVITGRDSSLRDIITNATGGWLGASLANSWQHWVLPKLRQRRRIAILLAMLWTAVIAATMWAAQPPATKVRLFGQYAPIVSSLPEFKAQIIDAAFNGTPLPVGAFDDQNAVSSAFKRRHAWLSATVTKPPPTSGRATIIAVVDARQAELLTLSQSGDDLLCDVRLRSDEFGLSSPTLRLRGVFRKNSSVARVNVGGGVVGDSIMVEAREGAQVFSNALRLTPGAGWIFLYPFELTSPWIVCLLAFAWMSILTLALQYFWSLWIRSSHRRAWFLLIPPILTTLVLALPPKLFDSGPASASEILGLALGLGLGEYLSRLAQRPSHSLSRQAAASKPLA